MPAPSEPAGPEGALIPSSPGPEAEQLRRSSRPRPEKRGRPSLHAGAQIVYRVGRTILRRDRDDLEDTLLDFHANPVIQNECRTVLDNAAQYLKAQFLPRKGDHYVASCDIPAGVRLAFYSGFIERAAARHSRDHEMHMGEVGLGFKVTIDGTPGREPEDDARLGRLQIVNHCCRPGNNCDCLIITCNITFLPLYVLVSNVAITAGDEVAFPYQEPHVENGTPVIARGAFWQDADSLTVVPRGMEVIRCRCQRICPNGWGRLEKTKPPQSAPAPPHPPPPHIPHTSPPPQPHPPSKPPPSPSPSAPHPHPSTPPPPFPLPPFQISPPPPPPPAFSPPPRPPRPPPAPLHPPFQLPCPPPSVHLLPSPTHPPPALISINVGRVGFCESLPHLLALFEALPAAVLFQEAHLAPSALAEARALAHRLLPMYCMFSSRKAGSANIVAQLQTVTLVHVQLAARASLLDVSQQCSAPEIRRAAPDVLCHAHFIRIIDPRSEVSLLIANCYQYQTSQPEKQAALLALVSSVIDRWSPQTDHVILGGDWNASLKPRIGYCGAPPTVLADERLLQWSVGAGLRCTAPEDPTWSSYNEQRHSVLDCFFWKSRGGGSDAVSAAMAFPSPDPRHDHRGVRIALQMDGMTAMPPAESLWRPLRLQMQAWARKRADWQTAVEKVLMAPDAAELPSDPFARLDRLKGVALTCAKRVLGESGGKLRRLIPHHSDAVRRLMSRLKLLKVVRRELHARRDGVPKVPSRAMRKLWDAGVYPRPAEFGALSTLWSPPHRDWTDSWLRMLRHQSQQGEEELHALRRAERSQASEQSRQRAIARFYDGGELRRLLQPQSPPCTHSPMLRSCVPARIAVTGDRPSLQALRITLAGIPELEFLHHSDSVVVAGIRPANLLACLQAAAQPPLQVRLLPAGPRLAHTATDRLSAWEYSLASEATAKQGVCSRCLAKDIIPVTSIDGSSRRMVTWCSRCSATTTLLVRMSAYDEIPLRLEHLPRIPVGSGETLAGAISRDDYDYFVRQLPCRTAPGPDRLPYEMLRCAPEPLKVAVLECINAILTKQTRPPANWLGGLIRFLFKKGDLLDTACYRPVCLQDCTYKLLSGILTDRLYRLAERYGLLDPSQEGFRRLHSTQRQVQSLHWAFEQAANKRQQLFVVYLDFANAFNSVDHEALWRWLSELNVPDVDLLRSLYDQSHYVADLLYGQSAPIPLTRGTKQGDKLSPLLFGLIFNCLLLALRASGVAHRTISGLRTPARGFADDLVLCTESAAAMGHLLDVVADFCRWSGMQVKLEKSVATAFDFQQQQELSTAGILYQGTPLVHLAASESFPYLGVRASILASTSRFSRRRKWQAASSPNLAAEKAHIFSATKELAIVAKQHRYLLSQMVPAMQMVATGRFRYSAALVPWTDAELDRLHKVWLQVHRAAWRLSPGFASAPFMLPEQKGGCPVAHPRVLMIQALTLHIEQLVALPDELRQNTITRFRRLCEQCGCHTERELAEYLQECRTPPRCPIARLLRACGQLGVQIRLPAVLSLGKVQRELSWHGLLQHLRGRASVAEAEAQLKADVATLVASWTTLRRCLQRRGIRYPRMMVVNPRRPPVLWLVPMTIPRNPGWLEPLRRVLPTVDTALLFPPLDRGQGVPEVPAHQALLHDVIGGLKRGDCPIPSLFADERWNAVRSAIPWHSWQHVLLRHGLAGATEPWTGTERFTGPILDLLHLGACPGIAPDVLLDLVIALGPYIRSSQGRDAAMEDSLRGPLGCAPVRLLLPADAFVFTDSTGGQAVYGPYTTTTKDGLVRVEQAGSHIGIIKQSRWGWLAAAYEAEDVCAALPRWIAGVDQDELSRGIPSAQFWTQVQEVIEASCIIGCNPLVAPSAFPCAYRTWGTREGWGRWDGSPSVCTVYNLLTLTMPEQRQNCLVCGGLTAGGTWYALTRKSTLDPQVKARLEVEAIPVHVFRRGTRAAAARGSWRKGISKVTRTAEGWTLWASAAAVASQQGREELKLRLSCLRLTADGVDPSDSYSREAAYGPAGNAYQFPGIIVATDGSLKDDGRMGAAFVSMRNRLPSRSVTVFGSASSTRPELTGIALALEASPPNEDLTILTDSLVAMTTLFSLRRADFPVSLHGNACRQLLTYVVRLFNRRHEAGVVTRLVKVKSHCGEPLNEAADALASAAAEADDWPSPCPLHLDPDSVHFYLNGAPVEWGSSVRNRLIQMAADRVATELSRQRLRRDGAARPVAITTAWLLRQDQGRQVLGETLKKLKTDSSKRRVLQTIAGAFPGNALLCRWKLRSTATCDLCSCPAETQAHIQCACPALKGARIAAHHTLAGMIFDTVREAGGGWDIHRELTVAGLQGIPVPQAAMGDWYRMCDELAEQDLMTDTEADLPLASSIRRKRPDGWAVHWGQHMIRILEFTRCNDYRQDWRETTEQYKTRRYQPLRDRMAELLPRGWSVEIVNFTLGIRGSFAETCWTEALTGLGVSEAEVAHLMAALVAQCLTELNELYSTRATALRQGADAQA